MITIKWEHFLFSTEAVQMGSLMGDPGRQDWRLRFPSPQGRTLGALGEELGTPTKAGAAPPCRGLPDEGGGVPGPLLVRREPPPEG
jgi:hypothetical protein